MASLFELMNNLGQSGTAMLVDVSVKSAVILLAAAIAARLLHQAPAAVRHRVWSLGLCGALLMPLLSWTVPQIRLPVLPTKAASSVSISETSSAKSSTPPQKTVAVASLLHDTDEGARSTNEDPSFRQPFELDSAVMRPARAGDLSLTLTPATLRQNSNPVAFSQLAHLDFRAYLLGVWMAGLAIVLTPLAVGFGLNWLLLRKSRRLTNARYMRLIAELSMRIGLTRNITAFESPQPVVPMTWGFLRPLVLVPEGWRDWPEERQRCVLLHELAHVKRLDVVFQIMGRLAAALHWFNPLVWWAVRQLRIERELACDDCVLASGERASDYARELLKIAKLYRLRPLAVGVAMAHSARLDQRVLRILDQARSRLPMTPRAARCLFVTAAVLVLGVAATSLVERSTSALAQENPSKQAGGGPQREAGKAAEVSRNQAVVRGVVLKPDGSPAAGATIRAAVSMYADLKQLLGEDFETPMSIATADIEGRFEIAINKNPFGDLDLSGTRFDGLWKETTIAASLAGFGCDWIAYREVDENDSLILKLVEDMPLSGRVVNLEGEPVSGVTVKIAGVQASDSEDLSAWLDAVVVGETPQTAHRHVPRHADLRIAGIDEMRITDADGRFGIRGLGRERVARLQLVGENVAFQRVQAVTRDMKTVTQLIFDGITEQVHGANFVLSVSPSQPVEGLVVDAETKAPLAGIRVQADRFAGSMLGGRKELMTTTDEKGRFRLTGLPKAQLNAERGRTHNYLMLRPADDQPYLMRRSQVPIGEGLEVIGMTAELHRGIWIQGRVTDKVTGKGVPAVRMHYLAYRNNEFAQRLPEFDDNGNVDGDQTRYQSDREGNYRLVGLPGPAVIGAESVVKPYRFGVGYEQLNIKEPGAAYGLFYSNPIPPGPKWPNAVVAIDPAADTESVELNFELDPGATVDLSVVDERDTLVTGATLRGLTARFGGSEVTESRAYQIINLTRDENRPIIVHHAGRNIGQVARVKPDHIDRGRITIRLQECAKVTGTLTDEGRPLGGIRIEPRILPHGDFGASLPAFTTDQEGHFESTLLPGTSYKLFANGKGLDYYAVVADELQPQPGKAIDLGTLALTPDRKFVRKDAAAAEAGQEQTFQSIEQANEATTRLEQGPIENQGDFRRVSGTVIDESGNPVIGAIVAAVGLRFAYGQQATTDVLAEQRADVDGRFQLSIPAAKFKNYQYSSVIALGKSMAAVFKPLHLKTDDTDVNLTMKPEEPIHVRLIDIEGQSAANVQVQLTAIMASEIEGVGLQGIVLNNLQGFGKLRTDKNGRLTIHNIAAGHGVLLNVAGTEKVAPQEMALNTGMPEERGERDATYRSLVLNMEAGKTGTLALAPAHFFEGVVLLGDTGKPAAGVKVSVGSSQQAIGGSMSSVQGTTDEQGRFRINARPGVRFRITAHPPEGSAFQIRTLDELKWDSAASSKNIEIKLAEGVVAHGTVVDAETNRPLSAAYVQYLPDQRHNQNITPDVVTGWQGIQRTGERGEFRIPVFPGPGTLLVHAPDDGSYVLQAATRQELEGQTGGQRMYAHAFQSIDPAVGQPMEAITIRLTPGTTVVPRVVDASGMPVNDATVVSRLRIAPTSPYWRAYGGDSLSGRLQVAGLAAGERYETYFLDSKRRLGATAELTAEDRNPTIKLIPCGSAKATFVDQQGKPIANNGGYGLYMVVTPGPSRYDVPAMRRGQIVADEDFAVNVDRLNHDELKTDARGEIIFPALIPGATYRFHQRVRGRWKIEKEFEAESGKTFDMGRIVVEVAEE